MAFSLDIFKSKPAAVPVPVVPSAKKVYTFGDASVSKGAYITNPQFSNKMNELNVYWDLYTAHHWVHRCISLIAQAASKSYQIVPADADVIAKPGEADIIHQLLNCPNPQDTFHDFLFKIVRDMIVFGVCFIEVQSANADAAKVRPIIEKAMSQFAGVVQDIDQETEDLIGAVVTDGLPSFMRVLPAQQMEVKTDDYGNILYYEQWQISGKRVKFAPGEILQILHPHSQDPRYGESSLKSLATVATTDILVDARQKKILQNDISWEWLLSIPDVAEEEAKRIWEQIVTMHRQQNTNFNGMVTTADFKIEHLAISKDGDFLNLGLDHRNTIAMCLGIPISVLGDVSGNSMNGAASDSHMRNFIENTCRPLSMKVETILTREIISRFQAVGLNYRLDIVLEDADDQADRVEAQVSEISNGLKTINEIRAIENMDPLEGGDKAYILAGNTVVPVDQIGVVPEPPPAPIIHTGPLPLPGATDTPEETAKKARLVLNALRKAF